MSSPDPTTMTLYYFPRACSLAVHIILEETGLPYDTVLVNLNTKAQKEPEYLAVNPGGRVSRAACRRPAVDRDPGNTYLPWRSHPGEEPAAPGPVISNAIVPTK